jgi:hypothetical protein
MIELDRQRALISYRWACCGAEWRPPGSSRKNCFSVIGGPRGPGSRPYRPLGTPNFYRSSHTSRSTGTRPPKNLNKVDWICTPGRWSFRLSVASSSGSLFY